MASGLKKFFGGREIEVVDFDDAISGEHLIEFRDVGWKAKEAVLAIVIPEGGTWDDAILSVNPRRSELSVSFVAWAIGIAGGLLQ